jgi:hypothetical protein
MTDYSVRNRAQQSRLQHGIGKNIRVHKTKTQWRNWEPQGRAITGPVNCQWLRN